MRLAAALIALAMVPGAAGAQGSGAARAADASARSTHAIALCLVRRDARRAAAFLSTPPTETQARLLSDFGTVLNDCAAEVGGEGEELRLSAGSLRGPVAEAFFERDFNGWTARSGRRPVPVYAVTPPPAQVPRARLLADMAACVAEARPTEVLALFATTPESPGEEGALGALTPALGPCLRAGQTADVTRAQLRGLLAEAAYRRAAGLAQRG